MEVVAIATGYIQIIVSDTDAQPLTNVHIHICPTDDPKAILQETTTREDGKTESISLQAPDKLHSLTPSSKCPYALYRIHALLEGYETEIVEQVQIFPDCSSLLPIRMKKETAPMKKENHTKIDVHSLYAKQEADHA